VVAFGWYGGKYSHLDWLLPLLPPSQLRVQIENAPAMSEPKLENCGRSQELELDGSIESMPPNPKHSGFMSASGDLPTEIDGSSHDGEEATVNDQIRQERLKSLGVRFLRFTDADVKRNMEMVMGSIDLWIDPLSD
jgi:Protein of unknown function (DUF559)